MCQMTFLPRHEFRAGNGICTVFLGKMWGYVHGSVSADILQNMQAPCGDPLHMQACRGGSPVGAGMSPGIPRRCRNAATADGHYAAARLRKTLRKSKNVLAPLGPFSISPCLLGAGRRDGTGWEVRPGPGGEGLALDSGMKTHPPLRFTLDFH